MSEEKQGQCLPSQVTINIGTSGVKINDEAKPAAPAVDLTKYVTREVADSIYAPRTQVAAMGDSIRATRSAAEQTKADGEATKRIAEHAEELTQALAKNLAVFPRVLRLDKGQAIPADTPLGTVIVRTERAISHADDLFPPIGEWPKISAADTGDGVRLDFQHSALVPGLDQLKPSDGKWLLTMRYSFPGGNFGEEEAQVNLWTARRYQEEGHPAQVDQGSKIADLTVRKGDHLELSLEIEPRKVDEKIGDVWGVWLDAPIPVLYVHDLVIRKIA
jgi:hypothetical protein